VLSVKSRAPLGVVLVDVVMFPTDRYKIAANIMGIIITKNTMIIMIVINIFESSFFGTWGYAGVCIAKG